MSSLFDLGDNHRNTKAGGESKGQEAEDVVSDEIESRHKEGYLRGETDLNSSLEILRGQPDNLLLVAP